ncbi:carbohydrate ABC transporter permease [Streptomyces phaeochromogenes]
MTVSVERDGTGGRGSRNGPGSRSGRGSRGGGSVEALHRAKRPRHPHDSYALFLLPGALAFFAIIVVPFLMNTGVSFTEWQGVGTPKWTGLANYRELLDDSEFWASFRHSLFMVVAMAAVPTVVGLVLAAALFDFVGKHFGSRTVAVLRACFYLPQVLPIAVAGIVWSWILAPENGSLNELLKAIGLGSLQQDWLGDPDLALYTVMGVMVWVQLGFPLVVFMAGLQRVDPQLYEAAELDGAGWWRRFWHITLPQIRPEIYVVLLWCTIAALKVFGAVYVLTKGGPGGATNVPSYFSFTTFFEKTQVGYGAAISTVLTVIILVLALAGLKLQTRAEDAEEGLRV